MWPWVLRMSAAALAFIGTAVLGALARGLQSETHRLTVLLSPGAALLTVALALILLVSAVLIVASPPARPTQPR